MENPNYDDFLLDYEELGLVYGALKLRVAILKQHIETNEFATPKQDKVLKDVMALMYKVRAELTNTREAGRPK